MGKKKSIIAKKKQAKQASRKFGVVVKKATGGREQSSASSVLMFPNGITKTNHLQKSQQRRKPFPSVSPKTQLQRKKNDDEHDDFERQMASAQERSQAAGRTKKKTPQQLTLTPATLIVEDKHKPTSRLLQETTSHLESGLNGIGATTVPPPQHRSLASYHFASNRNHAWTTNNGSEPCTLESDNPYAALHQEDDDGDDEAQQVVAPTLPLFRLAPPTFAFNNTNDDDVDPDL